MDEQVTKLVGWLSFDETDTIYCMDEKGSVFCISWSEFVEESVDDNMMHAINRDWADKLRSLACKIEEMADEYDEIAEIKNNTEREYNEFISSQTQEDG